MKKKNSILILGLTFAIVFASLISAGSMTYRNIIERRVADKVSGAQYKEEETSVSLNTRSGEIKKTELKMANKLYNQGKYDEALILYQKILDLYLQEREKGNLQDENTIESVYLKLARCKAKLGNLEDAEKTLGAVIEEAKAGKFSQNMAARMQLEIGNLYLRKKDYLTALEEFEKVSVSFSETKYAQFASEKIKKIEGWKVGEIKGLAILEGQSNQSGIDISLFDGESFIQVQTDSEGIYAIPVFNSTQGVYVSLFLSKDGYKPQYAYIQLDDDSFYDIGAIKLNSLENPQKGVLVGVLYDFAVGGKISPVFGISKLENDAKIKIKSNTKIFYTTTGKGGEFIAITEPGIYTLEAEKGGEKKEVVVKAGKTSFCNLRLIQELRD
ncbi:MAG: tetratricopeptide repeat protein [candidate division Zixibacteria bacterium]|nr:tetratricopeptide repeat protein [candidate division Zixibacteria bacterium]